jgi:hypothetical protein
MFYFQRNHIPNTFMKIIATFLLLTCLCGCAPFLTSKNGTPPPIGRVLIVSKLSRTTPAYLSEFTITFPARYTVCAVNVGTLSYGDPDSLIRQMAATCNADAVLTISQGPDNGIRAGVLFYRNVNDILLEMATYPGGKPFWKGLTSAPVMRRNPILPDRLVRRLIEDKVLQGRISTY